MPNLHRFVFFVFSTFFCQDRKAWNNAIQKISDSFRAKDDNDVDELMSITEDDARSVAAMNAILAQPVTEEVVLFFILVI